LPTPFDRAFATKLGCKAVKYAVQLIEKVATDDGKVVCDTADSAVVLGLIKRQNEFTPVEILKAKTDMEYVNKKRILLIVINELFISIVCFLDIACHLSNGG
jgi:6-phosphofructokinase